MIKFKHRGNFNHLEKFLIGAKNIDFNTILAPYGQQGVAALSEATPKRSGEAASSWSYDIQVKSGQVEIIWSNSKMAGNVPLVILIQYGHGTGTGGYVQGHEFINSALYPVFDKILNDVWREVTTL